MTPYYTWNKPFRKRRGKKYRELRLEELETREMLSAVTGIAPNVTFETEGLVSPVEWHAPETPVAKSSTEDSPTAVPTATAVSVETVSPEETGEGFAPVLSADMVNQLMAAPRWLEEMDTSRISQQFEDGGIPPSLNIPGIPGGDTGGVAGYNGGGRLPLRIDGFNGYGNAYYLDINDQTLPRIVWLYAEYYRNQVRLVPSRVALNRPVAQDQTNLYFDGARMTENVYNLIPEQPVEEKKDEKIIPAPPKKSETPPEEKPKAVTEEQLEKTLPQTLDDLPTLENETQETEQKPEREPESESEEKPILPPEREKKPQKTREEKTENPEKQTTDVAAPAKLPSDDVRR